MLAAHPELNNTFNSTSQATGHQAKALAGALYAYAANIDNLAALGPMLELVCQKHASLHITPPQYATVGKYLLEAMQEILGDAFTPAIHGAWGAAYGQLADVMIEKEAALYEQDKEWDHWRSFFVSKIERESDEVTSFYLKPVDGKPTPSFVPGQYTSIRTHVPGIGYTQARQYSLSDLPSSQHYRISVKRESGPPTPGLVSNLLHQLDTPGKILELSRPRGGFFLTSTRDNSPIVLMAAGVGITPLISMFKCLASNMSRTKRQVHLIHATRTTTARAFSGSIGEIANAHSTMRATFFVESPKQGDHRGIDYTHVGRINLQHLRPQQDLFLNDTRTEYYICGPSLFMQSIENSLSVQGVSSHRIKMELFGSGGPVMEKSQAHL